MKGVFVALQVMALVALLATYLVIPTGIDDWLIWASLAIFYAYAWGAISSPVVIRPGIPTFLNINVLFLVFYYILYFFPYQMHVLGSSNLYDPGPFLSSFPEQSNQAVLAAAIGIVAFSLGLGRSVRPPEDAVLANDTRPSQYVQIEAIALIGLVTLIVLYLAAGWRTEGEGRYTGTASGGVAAEGVSLIIIMLAMISITLFVLELARGARVRLVHWMGLAATGFWALRLLSAGDRNSFLLLALVGVAGFFTLCRPIGRLTIAALLAIALISYNVVEVVRMTGDLSFDAVVQYFSQPSKGGDSQSSFNFTTISARAAIYAVPDLFDYSYGFFKFVGLAGVIPLIRGALLGDSTLFTSSAEIVTSVMLGPNASWSVGSNVLSDIYLDFGPFGVPLVMFLVGRFAQIIQMAAMRNPFSPLSISIYLATLALIAETPRYSVDFPVRILVWMAMFFWLHRLVAGRRSGTGKPTLAGFTQQVGSPTPSKPEVG